MKVRVVESQDDEQMIDNVHWDATVADIADNRAEASLRL